MILGIIIHKKVTFSYNIFNKMSGLRFKHLEGVSADRMHVIYVLYLV